MLSSNLQNLSNSSPAIPAFVSSELRRTPFLANLSETDRAVLLAGAQVLLLKKEDIVVAQGQDVYFLFFVMSGTLRLARIDPSGRRIISGFAFGSDFGAVSGDFVGACFGDLYPFSLEAIDNAVVCQIPRQNVFAVNLNNPAFQLCLHQIVSDEYLKADIHLDIIAAGSVCSKLARFLLLLAKRIGQPHPDGTLIKMNMSRYDIADYLGHSPEAVCRAFAKLRGSGAIAHPQDQRNLVLVRETGLKRIAFEQDGRLRTP